METIDHRTLRQWLDLDVDGALSSAEREQLAVHLANDAELRAEKRRLESLLHGMDETRVEVDADFKDAVMASLPSAAWEKGRAVWRLPLAMMAVFSIAATWLLSGSMAEHPVLGTGLAMFDFLQASTLAGAGLLTASWQGLGLALEELFTGFDPSFFALVAFVVCLDLLFLSMLRRRSRRPAAETVSTRDKASS